MAHSGTLIQTTVSRRTASIASGSFWCKVLLSSCLCVLQHQYSIAYHYVSDCAAADPTHDTLRPYVAFHAALRSAHHSFIARLEDQCKSLLQHHLQAATSEFAVASIAGKA